MAQMLDMMVNELQNNWDEQLSHVEFANSNSVSAATGLAPNDVHTGRLPRLPLTIFERTAVADDQALVRDHFTYCDLVTDRQQRAYTIVREHRALTFSRGTPQLGPLRRAAPGSQIRRCWVWVCNTDATIRNFPNPKQLWWGGACEPHDGPNAGYGGQRAPK